MPACLPQYLHDDFAVARAGVELEEHDRLPRAQGHGAPSTKGRDTMDYLYAEALLKTVDA